MRKSPGLVASGLHGNVGYGPKLGTPGAQILFAMD